ncbi:hypothetical protein IMZ48_27315 [Candidatus Bathyarchaeota archaeon]|nr:hypothetical protein [Candidatus Bathyarchaeota archaeon]
MLPHPVPRPSNASHIDAVGNSGLLAHSTPQPRKRAPRNNRERIYGHLPIPTDKDYKVAFQKRDEAAKARLLHSTIDKAKWEKQQCPPCTNCAVYLANWEGPEEALAHSASRGLDHRRASAAWRMGRRANRLSITSVT